MKQMWLLCNSWVVKTEDKKTNRVEYWLLNNDTNEYRYYAFIDETMFMEYFWLIYNYS